jgi:hypothetical protein
MEGGIKPFFPPDFMVSRLPVKKLSTHRGAFGSRLELGRGHRSVRTIGVRWQTWIMKYDAAIMLFGIVVLSFCNVVVSLGFSFFLRVQKPLPELSAFFLHFHYLVTSLAVLWLLAGILAFIFLKNAVRYFYLLVWLQLAISAYIWYSTLHFLSN